MLEKLLPFLSRAQKQSSEVNQPSNSAEELSDSLVAPENIPSKILNGYFYFSVVIFVVFFILVAINTVFKVSLDSQRVIQTNLLSNLGSIENQRKEVISIDKKISFYKNSLSTRKVLSEKTHLVLNKVMAGLVVNEIEISDEKFQISLVGNNVYLFTQLIMAYLQDGGVSEISISSATYSPGNMEFKVELVGVFK